MKNYNLRRFKTISMMVLLIFSFIGTSFTAEAKKSKSDDQKVVVIDPGCQAIENNTKESVGPGAWKWAEDDMVGATGAVTSNNEYDINLLVALKTQKELEKQGYRVEMTRITNDVNISSAERAMFANTLEADLYVTIRSSAKSSKSSGITVVCETEDNPYNFVTYSYCRLLADTLRGCLAERTADASKDVVETDDIIGINWCQMPNAIVIVGNIKNESDDQKLANEEYQQKLAEGIAAGVDSYFEQR
ncbi:N-acetylmuramoyl-L-alanine amidase family protein [Pseudobutyrivibrio xylanivorans]|uniref:N-acetylmuramoyl-L-alanine amidase n=1 Tax=Pseudobutyrivibrio xylanivorans TaxID=185007 RepID=A0A5P6VQ44_PSEXY|nr:N-acetylmuramoyl-L-alanine amidase [Pseudobutyrivibrio xylanivorans]QFJ54438.1 N-acetylmuramoyl-L-alanine amidase [Pseudobutyrivibrio xylanivorans]